MHLALIEEYEERLRRAMIGSNIEELEVLLSDELVFTTFLGEKIGKRQELEAHLSGTFAILGIELSDQNYQFVAGTCIVTCQADIDATFDGDKSAQSFRFSRVWAMNSAGTLQVVAGQATLVYASL